MGVPDRDMLRKQLILGAVLLVAATEAVWKPKGNMHAHEHPDRLFRNGDKNKDDKLDAAELKDFYKDGLVEIEEYKKTHYGKERVIGASHDGFLEHFTDIDTDKDGKINKKEWLANPSAWDAFTHMDYNKDGVVEFDEFAKNEREHYHGLNFDHPDSIKHTREAFDILDRNKDGKLTRAEDRSVQPGQEAEFEKIKYDDDGEEEEEEEDEEEDTKNEL